MEEEKAQDKGNDEEFRLVKLMNRKLSSGSGSPEHSDLGIPEEKLQRNFSPPRQSSLLGSSEDLNILPPRRINSALGSFNDLCIDNEDLDVLDVDSISADLKKILDQEDPVVEFSTKDMKLEGDTPNIAQMIQLMLTPRFGIHKLSDVNKTSMPVMVSLKTNEMNMKALKKAPIDLFCVIDRSGSMEGEKLTLVKQSLKQLLKLLSGENRICLIDFQSTSKILTPLLRNTESNFDRILDEIIDLKATGGTNMTSGVKNALSVLKHRKYKNPISCIFLLSDGCDDKKGADKRIESAINKFNIQDNFVINTFGYGNDHEPETMRNIAHIKNGNFYYIEDLKKVDQYFVLATSGLLTVIADKIQIRVGVTPDSEQLFKKERARISKTYGGTSLWLYDPDREEYVISLNHLLGGISKDYFIEVEIPAQRKPFQDQEKTITLLRASLTAVNVFDDSLIVKKQEFAAQFANYDEKVKELEEKPDLEVNYFRVRSAETIGESAKLANENKYEDAKAILNALIQELKKSKYAGDPVLKVIIDDCNTALELCNPKVFEERGKAYMYKKEFAHMNRVSSANNILYANEYQEDLMNDLFN